MHRAPLLVPLFLLVLAGVAAASCGLQSCPRPAHAAPEAGWEAGLRTRAVAFEGEGVAGSYVIWSPRLSWRTASWALSAEVPFTRLESGAAARTGLSNPLLAAVYGRRLSHAWTGEAGLQLELPLGDAEAGLADDHVMVLPWIGVGLDLGSSWRVAALLGHAVAMGPEGSREQGTLAKVAHAGEDHGTGARAVVNPHGDRESHWRLGLTRFLGPSALEAFAHGQNDWSDGGRAYARAGMSWEFARSRAFGLALSAEAPVTTARRADGELGLMLKTGW